MRIVAAMVLALVFGCGTGQAQNVANATTTDKPAAVVPAHELPLARVDLLELKNLRLEQEALQAKAQAIQAQLQMLQANFTQRQQDMDTFARGVIAKALPTAKPTDIEVDTDKGVLRYNDGK